MLLFIVNAYEEDEGILAADLRGLARIFLFVYFYPATKIGGQVQRARHPAHRGLRPGGRALVYLNGFIIISLFSNLKPSCISSVIK
jgi:hypothetical protein